MATAPPPDSSVPVMGAGEALEVGEGSIQGQAGSRKETKEKEVVVVAPKAASWVAVAQEKKIIEHGLKEKETGKGAYPQEDRGEQTEVMEAIAQSNTEEEVEEGEVIEWWLNVSPGKTSRSPKTKALQYGQVKIASRYSALENADDNGDLAKYIEEKESEIIKEAEQKDNEKVKETEEKDNEMVKETEKKDSEEAKEIEEKENEVIKETEKKKNEVIKEKEKKDRDVALAAEIDGNAIEVDVSITGTPKTGNNEHESRRGTVTTNEIGKHKGERH
ncbi:hypothetical protein F2Q69_00060292 [Brassica cretica]|uniref:Uncharacterized protein n=1 Tax=Brassica cretica TaxID=69181 RepID=A0A8S9RPQ9_BRACR|nr:hypothetical protein F2Q69_00060292 [Brassica cretica]